MNNTTTKEKPKVIELARSINTLIEKEGDYNFLYGYQSGYEMSKNFIEMYGNEGIDKIKEVLDFQIDGIKRMREGYE